MALLGNLLGTVDGLLGGAAGSVAGSGSASASTDTSHTLDLGALVETSPSAGVNALGLADVSVSAPTAVGVTADVGHLDLGGLLHGLLLSGTVRTVSADRMTDDKSGQNYYSIEVALDANDVKKSRVDLQPGMPAEVVVPTRPRTLFEYLIGPLRDEINGAFRER